MAHRLRVGVLFGGRSTEHEISLLSARNVINALDSSRFEPALIAIDKRGRWFDVTPKSLAAGDSCPALSADCSPEHAVALRDGAQGAGMVFGAPASSQPAVKVDVVFPVLHGTLGEDGTVQGLLELLDLPYVGSGVLGSAVSMDKDVAKRLLRDSGIAVAPFVTVRCREYDQDPAGAVARAAELGFPLFTKPANAGSSVGVRRVAALDQLPSALEYALRFDSKVIAEQAIDGREIECAVLGNDEPIASVPGEVVVHHPDGFYSYDAKYLDENGAILKMPAELGDSEQRNVQSLAVRTFLALECSGMARVDFFLRPNGELIVNEVNTIPGFTAISMYPKLWELSGVGRVELVSRLIDLAIERKQRHRSRVTDLFNHQELPQP